MSYLSIGAMAIISEAVFSARLEAFGMEQEHLVKFRGEDLNNLGYFANSAAATPGPGGRHWLHHQAPHPDLWRY